MAGADLPPELCGRIERGVDVAPQAGLRRRQSIRHGGERRVTHHEHVYVAVTAQLAACRGAKDECHADAVRQAARGLPGAVSEGASRYEGAGPGRT